VKILILNWQDIRNPLGGGAEVHMQEIFSRIAGQGHEVTLYCSQTPGTPREEVIDGIRVIREGGRYFFNFYVAYRYLTRFRKEYFDIVVDDMNKIPFFTPLFVRKPLVVLIHHLFGKSIFSEALFPFALYVYMMEKLAVRLCKKYRVPMFVVSSSTRTEVVENGIVPADIRIVPNCVDHSRYRSLGIPRASYPLIGYFGRLKKYKSVEHLLQAMVIVKNKIPDARLVVIGDGDYRLALENRAKELSLGDAVRFTGYVDETEKVRLLNEVWFLVNTSAKEGWGLTVIEANACGTTVIASDVPGLRDAVKDGETGLLYEYGNVRELSEKIMLLLGDPALRDRLNREARAWSQSFDWQVVANQTVVMMQDIIKRYPQR
jgi:glycosyltransferase involved in cell wall biosynthesis